MNTFIKTLIVVVALGLLVPAISTPAGAQMGSQTDHKTAQQMEGEVKSADGIKGRLKITPSKSMLDLYLTDAATDKPITKAKVRAVITMPDGKKVEKDLMGMKMGGEFSFMNSADLSLKGKYTFDVTAEIGKKKVTFPFTYEVR